MIIENLGVTYYIPNEIGNDRTKTVAQIFEVAIPLELHHIQEELKNITVGTISDEEKIEYANDNMPEVQENEIKEMRIEELNTLIQDYGNN